MGYGNVIVLSLVTLSYGKFAFDNLEIVLNVALDISKVYGAGCVTIMRQPGLTSDEENFITNLTRSFAKNEGYKFQAMSYKFNNYLGKFLDESRATNGSCFKWTTIIMVTNTTRSSIHELVELYKIQSIYLMFANGSMFDVFDGINVRYDSQAWLIQPISEESVSITEVYQVQEGLEILFKANGIWSVDNGLEGFDCTRKRDLVGAVFRVGAQENWPITTFRRGNAGKTQEIDGYFACIWLEIGQMLNFSTLIVRSDVAGSEISYGNWSGLIGQAVRGEIDVILSDIDFSANRVDAITHLSPILRNSFQIFFAADDYVIDLLSVFHPFHYSVWIALLSWVFLGAAVLYMTCKISKRAGLIGTYEPSSTGAIFFILQTLSLQGSSTTPKIWAQRLFFLFSYLLAAIILTSYSAALISSLTIKTPNKPFDTMAEILRTNYKLIIPENTAYYDYFATSSDPLIQKIFHKHALNDSSVSSDLGKAEKHICQNTNTALFIHETFKELLHVNELPVHCSVLSLSEPVLKVYQSLAFPKSSPYQRTFNTIILRMMEHGLLQRQKLRYMAKYPEEITRPEFFVRLNNVAAIFIFLIVSLIISILILAIELMNCFSRTSIMK